MNRVTYLLFYKYLIILLFCAEVIGLILLYFLKKEPKWLNYVTPVVVSIFSIATLGLFFVK